jgi:predicted flap endonuclease-1-like 5' DNA nuclease
MPELTVMHFGLLGLSLIVGLAAGWYVRADRCAREKIAVNASWQDQLESQQSEHNRLAEQNKSLMEQISQYQASQKDYANRAKELSDSLREAFARRDVLQRQLKDARGNLEVAIAQRDRLVRNQKEPGVRSAALKEKDDKIFKLSRELTSWQSRVPPLVERFQEKSREAAELEEQLQKLQTRLQALEDLVKSDQTHIEPVDAGSLPDGGIASNEPIAVTSSHDASSIQDQIEDEVVPVEEFAEPVDSEGDDVIEDQEFGAVFSDDDSAGDGAPADGDLDAIFSAGEPVEAAEDADTDDIDSEDSVFAWQEDEPDVVEEDPAAPAVGQIDEDQDDLKLIKGIGPAIEKTLNDLGILRFHQIAEMSEYDIDRVAQRLKGFRSRIYREDWIGQARDFHYEKSNKRP